MRHAFPRLTSCLRMAFSECLRQGSFAPGKSRHVDHRGEIRQRRKRDSDWETRGYGRPATFSTTDTTQFKRAIDMTDDELAAIVAKARLTVVK